MQRQLLLTAALGTMLAPLNSTMIAVALPEVMAEFGVGMGQAGWLVTAYLVAMASLQPVAGKLGDALGRRYLILGGVTCFGLASLGAAVAPNLWLLLFFRVFQAIAGALVVPNGAALVREVVPTERRGGGFGAVGAAVVLAAAVGPPLGGLLTEAAGWRTIFYVNLALVLPAVVVGWRCLPRRGDRPVSPTAAAGGAFDLPGAVMLPMLLTGTAVVLMALTRGGQGMVAVTAGIGTLVLTTMFLWQEFRHPAPMLPPRLFSRREFGAANAGIALSNLAMYALLLSVPLLLASRGESSGLQSGLVLTAMSASTVLLAFPGGRLADRFGRRVPTVVGLALLTLGALLIALYGRDVPLVALVLGLLVAGVGLGLASSGLQTTPVESASLEEAGVASGVYSTSRYLGSIVGSAMLAGLLGAGRDAAGLEIVFIAVFVAALLSTLASLGLRAWPEGQRGA